MHIGYKNCILLYNCYHELKFYQDDPDKPCFHPPINLCNLRFFKSLTIISLHYHSHDINLILPLILTSLPPQILQDALLISPLPLSTYLPLLYNLMSLFLPITNLSEYYHCINKRKLCPFPTRSSKSTTFYLYF